MKIHKIRLKNLNSLRTEIELDFDNGPLSQSGLFAITGDTGAGKTTILDAITLALFGQTSRDHDKEVMSNGATEAYAEVEFSNEKGRYFARWSQKRTKSKDQPLKTHRELGRWDAAENSWATVETGRRVDSTSKEKGAVETALGLNYEQFKRTVLLAQGEFAAFLKADEKERAGVLERLTNTEEYSLLSRAAHLRTAEERRRLDQLNLQLGAIAVFDAAQLAELEENLREREREAAALDDERRARRENLAWLDRLDQLWQRIGVLELEQRRLDDDHAAFASEQLQLDRYRRTRSLQPALQRLTELETALGTDESRLAELSGRVAEVTAEERVLTTRLDAQRQTLAQAEQAATGTEQLLEQVILLDGQILRQRTHVDTLRHEFDGLTEKFTTSAQRLDEARRQRAQHEHQLVETRQWLERRAGDARLGVDAAYFENVHAARLREIATRLEGGAANRQKLHERRQTVRTDHRLLHDAAIEAAARLQNWRDRLRQHLDTHGLPASDEEAQHELGRRLRAASLHYQQVQDFARYHADYRRLARDLYDVRERQSALLAEDFYLGKEILSDLDVIDELRRKVVVKRDRHELELRRASYARDRVLLRPGEACPLCGATEHVLHAHDADEAFASDAADELRQAEKQLRDAEQRHAGRVARHVALREQIGATHDDFDGVMNTQVVQLHARLREYEQKIAGVLPEFALLVDEDDRLDTDFQQQLEALKSQVADIELQLKTLLTSLREIRRLEGEHHEAVQAEMEKTTELQVLTTELEQLDRQLTAAREQQEEELAAANALLDQYGVQLPDNDTATLRETAALLQERAARFDQHQQRATELQHQIDVLGAEIEQLERIVSERREEHQAKQAALEQEVATLSAWLGQRQALFGDRDPKAERAAHAARTQAARLLYDELQQQMQETAAARASLDAQRQQLEAQRADNSARHRQQADELDVRLRTAGFADRADLRAALLPDDAVATLERTAAALAQRATELAQSRRDAAAALDAEQQRAFELHERGEAQARWEAAENAYQAAQREIGSLQRQHTENEVRRRQAGALLEQIERQQREFDRWERLRALIGSHDGGVFRKFAQSLTLQQLIQHANRHLERLQGGRYRLHKKRGADLELEIIDRYQADFLRSVSTLSGGETFLASLALALGLADMANKRTRIQSLFIDEGFGALDENALELAITTLESLQAQGANIGIISHLRELKERISTQIQVVKKADGFSEVEIVG